ncbi:GDP-mannose mannosyl hydrolase [Halogeometricum limi]|uniref:Colanic acid biosynthesis protein WcaH n=1 Tax=Halogeometricum limi TaxID=555875 RepID=A0A1I6IJL8_9EURY|nr:NUDIX domain-containing protein [Halogeometricum limi]SFR66925.1 colanic acid biosynthesis protein WcaH [Halogeometricum limi]
MTKLPHEVDDSHRLSDDDWKTVVEHVPLVSVDMVVEHDGGIVLGKRQNEPAKGTWFVPGGTVWKGERLTDALQRVARGELGTEVSVERRLGTFEHFYDTSEFDDVVGKHYLATAFLVRPESDELRPDDQHAELRVFEPPFPSFHPYVERYLDAVEEVFD